MHETPNDNVNKAGCVRFPFSLLFGNYADVFKGRIMGACTQRYVILAETDEEAQKQFNEIVEDCKYNYGHGGYSGTFAEKTELKIVHKNNGEYWTSDELEEYLEADEKWDSKWGPAIGGLIDKGKYYLFGWCSE